MHKFICVIPWFFLMACSATQDSPKDEGKEKAIATLKKLQARRQLEVIVNRNGERKTMQVEVTPVEKANLQSSPEPKKE